MQSVRLSTEEFSRWRDIGEREKMLTAYASAGIRIVRAPNSQTLAHLPAPPLPEGEILPDMQRALENEPQRQRSIRLTTEQYGQWRDVNERARLKRELGAQGIEMLRGPGGAILDFITLNDLEDVVADVVDITPEQGEIDESIVVDCIKALRFEKSGYMRHRIKHYWTRDNKHRMMVEVLLGEE